MRSLVAGALLAGVAGGALAAWCQRAYDVHRAAARLDDRVCFFDFCDARLGAQLIALWLGPAALALAIGRLQAPPPAAPAPEVGLSGAGVARALAGTTLGAALFAWGVVRRVEPALLSSLLPAQPRVVSPADAVVLTAAAGMLLAQLARSAWRPGSAIALGGRDLPWFALAAALGTYLLLVRLTGLGLGP